jgi:sugar phosphate isomerase/epimerase
MRPIGFSTGAIAKNDIQGAVSAVLETGADAIELSALREDELSVLFNLLPHIPLNQFRYVSIHAPSRLFNMSELNLADALRPLAALGFNIVLHPDIVTNPPLWQEFGDRLCIENMDSRKFTGRTTTELYPLFMQLPAASLCFDIGHAWQVDRTMSEAERLLRTFGDRVRQLHISEVDPAGRHQPISAYTAYAFQKVSHLVPANVPWIIESPVSAGVALDSELRVVSRLFDTHCVA